MRRIVSLVLLSVFILAGVLPLYGSSQTTIVLTIGSTQASVNGEAVSFDVAPFIKDGRTFVPLRFVSEQLGAKVSYTIKSDGTVDRVTIKMGENLPSTPTSSPTPTPTPSSTPTSTPGWKEIARWSGNSIKSTEKFTVPNEWRLTWSCNGSGYMDIYVYRSNGDLFKVAASANEPGGDVSVFHEGGEFYLEIDTTVPYSIVIEGLF